MRWYRKWLRRLAPPGVLNKLNHLSHLEDRLYELEARRAQLARIVLASEFGSLFADLPPAEFQIFSQNGEDGILLRLLKQIGAPVKRFLEIGIENARECNTAVLAFVLGWDGVMVEADPLGAAAARKLAERMLKGRTNRVEVRCLKATPGNINHLMDGPELGGAFDRCGRNGLLALARLHANATPPGSDRIQCLLRPRTGRNGAL